MANTAAFNVFTLIDAVSRNAASAASLARMIVRPRTGSGPNSIASRRSNVSASHANTATSPTVIIE